MANKTAPSKSKSDEEIFKQEIRNLLIEWYTHCPQSMAFTRKVIKTYKDRFPDDNFMDDVNRNI